MVGMVETIFKDAEDDVFILFQLSLNMIAVPIVYGNNGVSQRAAQLRIHKLCPVVGYRTIFRIVSFEKTVN